MEDNILKIGTGKTDYFNLVGIGKGSYVLARTALNCPECIFIFTPTAIHLIHHSIETFIKAFLVHENIKYPYGNQGHNLVDLLKLGYEKSVNLFFLKKIIDRNDFTNLLNVLDQSYNENRYSFPGYSIKSESLRDLIDELVFIFIENIYELANKKQKVTEQLRYISVPKSFLSKMEYKQKQELIFWIMPDDVDL